MKIQMSRRNPKRKHSKVFQKSIPQSTTFFNNHFIQTQLSTKPEYSFLLPSLKQSLKTEININQQKKCANRLCQNYPQVFNIDTIQINLQTLCKICQQQFQKESFCLYCKQVYFDSTDDGKQWIMCEYCEKWVHSICADFNTQASQDIVYKCIKCTNIQVQLIQKKNHLKNRNSKLERKKNYEFLDTIGFQWELKPNQIDQDIESIKICKKPE